MHARNVITMMVEHLNGDVTLPAVVQINNNSFRIVDRALTEGTDEAFAEALTVKFFRHDEKHAGVDEPMTQSVRIILAAMIAAQSVVPRSSRPCA
ncbi:MAG: hypothetical protein V1778_01660 [bacterium]